MNKIKPILLMGPTATGKTQLALAVAQKYPIEIISVDSALIYKDMDIGTAKPTIGELQQVKHHLIDIISPLESYSVANFVTDAFKLIQDITRRGKIPLLVGGTMMYFNALLNGLSKLPPSDPKIRAKLEEKLSKVGLEALYQELLKIDKQIAEKIKPTDKQRVLRALEVYQIANIPMSQLQQDNYSSNLSVNFNCCFILPPNREVLHHRINERFSNMVHNGLIDEVQLLRNHYPQLTMNNTAMRCVGYKETWQYLDKQISERDLIALGQAATRQLAKRQITWLRRITSNLSKQHQLIPNLDINGDLNFETMLHQLFFNMSS